MSSGSNTGNKSFKTTGYFKITILGFGLGTFWGSLHTIVLPVRLLDFVPEAQKNTYFGLMTFVGLVLAMTTQPIIGTISDRSSFSWGRRRPFILMGISLAVFFLLGIGLWQSIIILFISYWLIQIAGNIAQSTYQGFIPDLVPEDRRGLASGVKTVMEKLGGFIILIPVAFFMDRYSPQSTSWLWVALGTMAVFLLAPMVVTVLTVKESPGTGIPGVSPFSRLYASFSIDIRRNSDFFWLLVSRGLMSIPGVALTTYLLYYVMDVFGMPNPAGVTANLITVAGVSLVITAYFAGRLFDKSERKPILILFAAGFIGALGILFFFISRNQTHLMLAGVVFGIANGAFLSSSWAQATKLLPEGEAARYLGLANLALAAGSGMARLIGPMIDYFNTVGHNLGYSAMLLISAVCFIAGSLVLLKVKEARRGQ